MSTIVIPICSSVVENLREKDGDKINVNTGSEACLYTLYGISCARVAFRIRAGGKASCCACVNGVRGKFNGSSYE